MRLLDRYLLRDLLVWLGYCLVAFLGLWIAFNLLGDLRGMQEDQMPIMAIAKFYFFKIPEFLPIAMPVALLLALLYTLTNHARHNEITAIRSAGVSLARICLPHFGVGLIASVILFGLNEYCVPVTSEIAEEIREGASRRRTAADRQLTRNLAFENKSANRFWRIGSFNRRTGEMFEPHVEWRLPDQTRRQLFAHRAAYSNDVWVFFDVRELRETRAGGTNSFPLRLPQSDVVAFPEFTETPEQIRSEISVMESFQFQSKTRTADIPIGEIVNYLRLHPNPDRSMRAWLETKFHGRLAGPFTCVVVVLIAIPFGAASGRRNVAVGVAASIGIFFFYYMLQQLGFAFGEAGRLPPWLGAWFPNLAFGLGGAWMMARVR